MNGARFTPSPIDWHERPPFITSISGSDTYEVNIKVHSLDELHAAHDLVLKAFSNARLIAAAPDLLEALYDLRAFVAVMVSHGPDARIPETIATPLGAQVKIGLIMDNATAAIAKAEGRS